MNKLLIWSTFIVILVTVESSNEKKEEASLSNPIAKIESYNPQVQQNVNLNPEHVREKRGSPVASIGAYITNYWEKKKRRTMKIKNKTRRPAYRPSNDIHRKHKHCYYDYY